MISAKALHSNAVVLTCCDSSIALNQGVTGLTASIAGSCQGAGG